jgi:hypothetical protein
MLGFVILFLESNESFKKPQKDGRSFHHLTENQAVSLSKCESAKCEVTQNHSSISNFWGQRNKPCYFGM